jgi:hypothetical protein
MTNTMTGLSDTLMTQMMRGQCNHCGFIFDLVALPGSVMRVGEAMATRCAHCPMCYRGEAILAAPRPLTADEIASKRRADDTRRPAADTAAPAAAETAALRAALTAAVHALRHGTNDYDAIYDAADHAMTMRDLEPVQRSDGGAP